MANLIVNADDFGLHECVNAAIAACVEAGSVNSISVIANGMAPDYGMLHRLKRKKVFIGIHLTWVGEPWITENIYFENWKKLTGKLLINGPLLIKKMEMEAEAQIDRLRAQGFKPDRIDSHQHVHHLPGIWAMVMRMKEKHKIPVIRIAKPGAVSLIRSGFQPLILHALALSKRKNAHQFFCAGIKHAGNYNLPRLAEELKKSAGLNTELIVHPGTDNRALNIHYGSWRFNWEKEYEALMSKEFMGCVSDSGFTILRNQ